jgi:hypothetical protein
VTTYFSDAELVALAASPADRMRVAFDSGDPELLATTVSEIRTAYRATIDGFDRWSELVQIWIAADATRTQSAGALPVETAFRVGHVHQLDERDLERREDVPVDLADYLQEEAGIRRVHDAMLDWLSALLSAVYRADGPDGLESCLRALGERTLLRWMELDLVTSPRERLEQWTALLHANFASIAVTETDESFLIVQDPCGSCTRQVQAGAYEPPLDLAVVRERHPTTYGFGDLPVYKTHVAIIHGVMATERTGAPWPIHQCPAHLGVGPCRIELRK